MSWILDRIAGVVVRWPRATIFVYAVLALLSAAGTVFLLELKADQNDLVGHDLEYNRRFQAFLAEFADLEFVYVVVRADRDPERAVRAAEVVAEELEALRGAGHVESVFHRIPLEKLGYGLLFRRPQEIAALAEEIERHRGLLASMGQADRFDRVLRVFAAALDPGSLAEAGEGQADVAAQREDFAGQSFRLLGVLLTALESGLDRSEIASLESAMERELGLSLRDRGYLATENERFLVVEVLPAKDTSTLEMIREPLIAIRSALDRVRTRFPGLEIGLTGRPVLQADEMADTDRDMKQATVVATVGIFLFFVLFFRRVRLPLLATVGLLSAVLLTFGLVSVTVGHLTLLSIVFAAMLIGLGTDYGIHFVVRYQEELALGKSLADAVRTTIVRTGKSVGTGAMTTAAALYTSLFVDFRGLQELGFIAGTGILISLFTMVTLVPALVLVVDRGGAARKRLVAMPPLHVSFFTAVVARPVATIVVLAVLSVVLSLGFRGLRFDYNLLKLQSPGLESVEYERLLTAESGAATWYAAFIKDGVAELRQVVEKLRPLQEAGIVGKVESVHDVIPEDQEAKLPFLARCATVLEGVTLTEPAADVDAAALRDALEELLERVDEVQDLLRRRGTRADAEAGRELDRLARRIEALASRVAAAPADAARLLAEPQSRWIADLHRLMAKVRGAFAQGPLTPSGLPEILKRRYVSKDGSRFLAHAYPAKDIWEEENIEEFITALRSVDAEVSGTPVQFYESAWRMRDGFEKTVVYSFIAVFVFLFLDMRSLRWVLLAMLPLLAGLGWLMQSLSILGVDFNLANFFAFPLLIGCGVDGGVYVVHRFRESRSSVDVAQSTSASIALCYVTNMVGFGSLVFAGHRGVRSLGLVMVIGLGCLCIAATVLLPAILSLGRAKSQRTGL